MPSTTTFDFGDVVLVPFPFTDQTTAKQRPAVVVSSAPYNRIKPDLVVVGITSRFPRTLSFGEVAVAQWRKAGLIKPSLVKPVFTTIEKALVIKKIGRLTLGDSQALMRVIRAVLGGTP